MSETKTIKTWEIEGVKVPPPYERILKIILSPETTGNKDLTLLLSLIYPKSQTDYHKHDGAAEIMYFVSGRGEAVSETGTYKIEPDTVFYAPSGVMHQIKNLSDEMMKIVCIYIPPISVSYLQKAAEAAKKT